MSRMKHKYGILVLLSMLASLPLMTSSAVAGARPCRMLEYAEIVEMSREELVKTYCEYEALLIANSNKSIEYMRLAFELGGDTAMQKISDEYSADGTHCSETMGKMATRMKKLRLIPEKGWETLTIQQQQRKLACPAPKVTP